jgi:branched-chain amino acid transport system permease protein
VTKLAAIAAVLAGLALVPLVGVSDFWVNAVTVTLMFALLGQAWNVLGGYGGQLSFGHAAFFGTGAYAVAILQVRFGWNAWAAAPVAIALGAGVGAAIGWLSFRSGLKGSYFALVTLAFAEVFRIVASALAITGGGQGLLIPLNPDAANLQFVSRAGYFYLALALFAVGLLATWALERSRFGAYLVAVRENEDSARALGVDTLDLKVRAIALSAALSALAGAFYAQYFLYLDSGVAYGAAISVEALLAPIVGGAGTLFGPLLGAVAMRLLSEATTAVSGGTAGVNLIVFGVLLVVMLRFLPDGLMGLVTRALRRVGALRKLGARP